MGASTESPRTSVSAERRGRRCLGDIVDSYSIRSSQELDCNRRNTYILSCLYRQPEIVEDLQRGLSRWRWSEQEANWRSIGVCSREETDCSLPSRSLSSRCPDMPSQQCSTFRLSSAISYRATSVCCCRPRANTAERNALA